MGVGDDEHIAHMPSHRLVLVRSFVRLLHREDAYGLLSISLVPRGVWNDNNSDLDFEYWNSFQPFVLFIPL